MTASSAAKAHNRYDELNPDDILDRVLGMKQKEETCYNYKSYFSGHEDDQQLHASWREKICQWSYNVVDHFDLSREVVAVSLDLFDRYLATLGNQCDGNTALLTSLTTMHLSIKLHERTTVKMDTLASLSRGQFSSRDIREMEWRVLAALQWKLHPPTPFAFASHFLSVLETSRKLREELRELARYMTELAVCDSTLVEIPASTIALGSILCVFDDTSYAKLPAGARERFFRCLRERFDLSVRSPSVMMAKERLRSFMRESGQEATNDCSFYDEMQVEQEDTDEPHNSEQEEEEYCNESYHEGYNNYDDYRQRYLWSSNIAGSKMRVSSYDRSCRFGRNRCCTKTNNNGDTKGNNNYFYSPSPCSCLPSYAAVAPSSLGAYRGRVTYNGVI